MPANPEQLVSSSPSPSRRDLWVQYPRPNPGAAMCLFCFPPAGSGAVMFRHWPDRLLPDLEVCSVQLPGRENRRKEQPFCRLSDLMPALTEAILPYLDKPFAFFGHSMGALIAFELARELRSTHGISPAHLFVSSHPAPDLPGSTRSMHKQSDRALLEEMARLGGTPQAILSNYELMQLLLPTLRADLELCETYEYTSAPPLDCPITAFGGSHDTKVTSADLRAWRSQTRGPFALVIYPGGHFFLLDSNVPLLGTICELLDVSCQ
jgi:medium-chain acyl-[acyl-carrier-protein] hydrolase